MQFKITYRKNIALKCNNLTANSKNNPEIFRSLMKKNNSKSGYSLIEISMIILIAITVIIAITQGLKIFKQTKLKAAQNLTNTSAVASMSGITLWFDASDSDSIATGTTIISSYGNPVDDEFVVHFEDRNPAILKHRSLSAPTDSNRPKYIRNGIGGLPSLSFDGKSGEKTDYLVTTPGAVPSGAKAFSFAIVFSEKDVRSQSQHFLISQGGSCIGADFGITTEDHIRYIGCGVGTTADFDSFLVTKNKTPYILIVNVDKNKPNEQISIYLNNKVVKGSQSTSRSLESNVFSVGRSAHGVGSFNGLISEIIVFDRYLDPTEITVIQDYLSEKYDIEF